MNRPKRDDYNAVTIHGYSVTDCVEYSAALEKYCDYLESLIIKLKNVTYNNIVLQKALDKACELLALGFGTPLNKDDVVIYTCNTPLITLDNSKEKWKEELIKEVRDE